mmetsp:Transcript_102262/g.184457  ORF Transcript_102262/g.184457 Transcript_102262/m.184457 type:complete len:231 (+) Transcript_102262:94-786(+)
MLVSLWLCFDDPSCLYACCLPISRESLASGPGLIERLLRWWHVGGGVHVAALADRVGLVVLAVNVVACAAQVEEEVVAGCGAVHWCEAECLSVRVIAAVWHHAESPRNWRWDVMDRKLCRIDGQVLTKPVERASLSGIRQSAVPELVQPLNRVPVRTLAVVGVLSIRHEEALLHKLISKCVQPHLLQEHPGLSARGDIHDRKVVADESAHETQELVAEAGEVLVHVSLHW